MRLCGPPQFFEFVVDIAVGLLPTARLLGSRLVAAGVLVLRCFLLLTLI